jgi:hypothetical protein
MPILSKIADWLNGYDRYELHSRAICHRHKWGLREEMLAIDEIAGWSIDPEIIFDVVEIRRTDGSVLVWLDYRNDLKAILEGLPARD